ncbi:TPA: hypothetical protein ACKOR7_001009 [Clostridioides difficile]
MALSLTACGSSGSDVKTAKEPVPASEAFNQEGVWFVFDNDGIIGKEEEIDDILVFDGKGNVIAYNVSLNNSLKFSKLIDKSTEEIIEMAKKTDKEIFDAQKEYVMTVVSSELSEEKLSIIKKTEYVAPEPQPIKLHIETDNTGNATQTESITYKKNRYNFYDYFSADNDTWYVQERTIEIFPDSGTQTVYDLNFRGFTNLTTLINGEHVGFMLDTPNTKGIEVDN